MSAADFEAVAEVLRTYFDGLHHSDTRRLRKVFHPRALYACASGETPLLLSMAEYYPIVDQRPSPASLGQPRRDSIVAIEFAGSVTALAKVECVIAPKAFIDLLSLIRVEGRWQIISKVFHYELIS